MFPIYWGQDNKQTNKKKTTTTILMCWKLFKFTNRRTTRTYSEIIRFLYRAAESEKAPKYCCETHNVRDRRDFIECELVLDDF